MMKIHDDPVVITINQNLKLFPKSNYIVSPVYTIVYNKLQVWNDLTSYHKNETVNKILLYLLTNQLVDFCKNIENISKEITDL